MSLVGKFDYFAYIQADASSVSLSLDDIDVAANKSLFRIIKPHTISLIFSSDEIVFVNSQIIQFCIY